MFKPAAIIVAYEKGMRAARLGHSPVDCPFPETEDWQRATAWRQGWRDMHNMLSQAEEMQEI